MTLDLRHTLACTTAQMRKIHALLREKGIGKPSTQAHIIYMMTGVESRTELTSSDAGDLIERLETIDRATLFLFIPRKEVE